MYYNFPESLPEVKVSGVSGVQDPKNNSECHINLERHFHTFTLQHTSKVWFKIKWLPSVDFDSRSRVITTGATKFDVVLFTEYIDGSVHKEWTNEIAFINYKFYNYAIIQLLRK